MYIIFKKREKIEMNIKKLMSTALLLLVGAGSAVGDGLPPADGEAPAANVSSEGENLAQSGAWAGIRYGVMW